MADFVNILTTNLDRPVLDRTKLEGHYNFTLTWDPPPAAENGPSWSPIGPSLFTPVRELGLRLDPQKAPVEMLAIDSIEHPTGNWSGRISPDGFAGLVRQRIRHR